MFRSLIRPARSVISFKTTARQGFSPIRIASSFIHTGNPLFKFEIDPRETEPLPPSWTEKYKLTDPTRWIPLTAGFFFILTKTGIYHWDEESQFLAVFIAYVALIYSQVGGPIGKYLDDKTEAILLEFTESEEINLAEIRKELEFNKKYLDYENNVVGMVDAQKKLEEDLRNVIPNSHEQRLNAFFIQRLNRIIAIETAAKESLQSTLINKATTAVTEAFSKDAQLQKKSLESAVAWLSAPSGQKKQSQDVGVEFKKFLTKAKKDANVTKEIETNMKEGIDRVLGDKYEVVDEYQFLKAAN